jgi:hypothetical protein
MTTHVNWKSEIVRLAYVKQELADVDRQKLWPWHLPTVAASEQEILECEHRLGFAFDPQFADFLRHANGWQGFIQSTDLFGTTDLGGGGRMPLAQEMLGYLEGDVLAQAGITKESVFPIAVSSVDLDLFVMTKPSSVPAGIVIWFAGYEIQRFSNFHEFFLAMVDYNILQIENLKKSDKAGH